MGCRLTVQNVNVERRPELGVSCLWEQSEDLQGKTSSERRRNRQCGRDAHGWAGPGGQSFIPATRPTVTAVATERFNALMRPREDAPARQPPRSHKLTQRDTICHNPRHRKPDQRAQVPARLRERALSEGASAGTFFQEGIVGMKNVLPGTQTACAPGHALEDLRR